MSHIEATKEYNAELADALTTLAEYIRMSEEPARVRIGLQFRLRKQRMRFPVMPLEKTLANVALWASEEVIKTVQAYQKATGNSDGQELIDGFRNLQKGMGG